MLTESNKPKSRLLLCIWLKSVENIIKKMYKIYWSRHVFVGTACFHTNLTQMISLFPYFKFRKKVFEFTFYAIQFPDCIWLLFSFWVRCSSCCCQMLSFVAAAACIWTRHQYQWMAHSCLCMYRCVWGFIVFVRTLT